jgi:hypothetical protein
VRDHPEVADYRLRLAANESGTGHLLRDMGRTTEALQSYRAATRILEGLIHDAPGNFDHRHLLTSVYQSIGFTEHRDFGRFPEAPASYRRAQSILEGLTRDN